MTRSTSPIRGRRLAALDLGLGLGLGLGRTTDPAPGPRWATTAAGSTAATTATVTVTVTAARVTADPPSTRWRPEMTPAPGTPPARPGITVPFEGIPLHRHR